MSAPPARASGVGTHGRYAIGGTRAPSYGKLQAVRDLAEDLAMRMAAFTFLDEQRIKLATTTGGLVGYEDVATFEFLGERIPLRDLTRGIRCPRRSPAALSLMTAYASDPTRRPYQDEEGDDGFLRYKWMGTDGQARDNQAMRAAMEAGLPLIWFFGVAAGLYEPIYPVYLVGEESEHHQFVVALERTEVIAWRDRGIYLELGGREYADRLVRQRVHQPLFRQRVLHAYGRRCALCRLRHPELLDAAHIRSDADGGEPVVPNGISMCKIHHAAFDRHIVGIGPQLNLVVRPDILEEIDGPMLRHGLQELHGQTLLVPTARAAQPNSALLAERFARFMAAS